MLTPLVDARSTGATLPAAGLPLQVVSGDVSRLSTGELHAAVVRPMANGQASLEMAGETVTVRMPFPVAEQSQLLVRVPAGPGQQTIEIVGQLFPQTSARTTATPSNSSVQNAVLQATGDGRFMIDVRGESVSLRGQQLRSGEPVLIRWIAQPTLPRSASESMAANQSASRTLSTDTSSKRAVVQVEVLDVLADGRLSVQIEGKRGIAVSSEPLSAGAKLVVQAETTATGWRIQPVNAGQVTVSEIATALIRSDSQTSTIGSSLQSLMNSLQAGKADSATPGLLQQIVARIVPENGKSPSSEQIISYLRDSGLTYEAKLAQQVDSQSSDAFRDIAERDLKAQLLNLLRDANAARTGAALDAAQTTLRSIEAQQAVNLIAQAQNGVYQLQIPLANPSQWETLRISYQQDHQGSGAGDDRSKGYDLLMHVSLSETGETWIDARVSGKQMRAVLYVEKAEARAQARSEIGDLKAALTDLGFERPLLDVRSTEDLPRGSAATRYDSLRRSEPAATAGVDRRA